MRTPLLVYLTLGVALLIGAIVIPAPIRGLINMLMVLGGAIVLTVNVARRRPQPLAAWWLIVAFAWTNIAEAVLVTLAYGLTETVLVTVTPAVLLVAVPYPLLAAALALLARVTARRGPVDTLDATMVALASFLLVWVFLIAHEFPLHASTATVVVVLPASALVAFALAVKIVLGGGLRDPATALLLLVVALLLAVTLTMFILGSEADALRTNAFTNLLWSAHGLLLGAIALLPSFARQRIGKDTATNDLSTRRLVLFSLLVLVPLIAWGENSFRGAQRSPTSVAVSLAVSALFLVMLVIRLALLARLAQGRADDLRGRSAELASAVSEQGALQEQLQFQATHDPLTGLANRAGLTDRLSSQPPGQHRASCALIMLDLDGFKRVNDTYGHPVGDELLIQTAGRLVAVAPPQTTLARLGGDEFVMLIENADRDAAARLAEHVVDRLREPYDVDSHRLQTTASVGVVVVTREQTVSSAKVLRIADAALYEAKEAGRDRAVVREVRPEALGTARPLGS